MSELFDPQKLVTIAENQEKVYNAGFAAGAATGIQAYHGKATVDGGILTTDVLPFKPQAIILWNIRKKDMAEEDPDWDPDQYQIRYFHTGVMLMALRLEDGTWVSQGMAQDSGGAFIVNESAEAGTGEFWDEETSSSGVWDYGNYYQIFLYRRSVDNTWDGEEFDYIAYGAV